MLNKTTASSLDLCLLSYNDKIKTIESLNINGEYFMAIYMTAQYQVHPSQTEEVKASIRPLVEHVKSHEPLTTIYIAQQQILDPSQFMHILRFEDEAALKTHQSSPASAQFVQTVYPQTLKPIEFMEYNLIATINS